MSGHGGVPVFEAPLVALRFERAQVPLSLAEVQIRPEHELYAPLREVVHPLRKMRVAGGADYMSAEQRACSAFLDATESLFNEVRLGSAARA
jgi:hypothetical protein